MEKAGTTAWNCKNAACDAVFVAAAETPIELIKCPNCGGDAKAIRANPSLVHPPGRDLGFLLLADSQG